MQPNPKTSTWYDLFCLKIEPLKFANWFLKLFMNVTKLSQHPSETEKYTILQTLRHVLYITVWILQFLFSYYKLFELVWSHNKVKIYTLCPNLKSGIWKNSSEDHTEEKKISLSHNINRTMSKNGRL